METTEIKAALARLEEKDKKKKAAEIEWPTEYVILYFNVFIFYLIFLNFFY
jgi:hypothetical protein